MYNDAANPCTMCFSNCEAVIVETYGCPSISVDDRQVATEDDQMRNDSRTVSLAAMSERGSRAKSSTGLSRDMVISESRVD